MTTCKIARFCSGQQNHVVRLAGFTRPVTLCVGCLEAARRLGMDPSPVPEWMARGVRGENRGAILSGPVAA